MKKLNLIIILCLALVACKSENNQSDSLDENTSKSYNQNDGFITMRGDFVYYADAAVLQTSNEIYGVVIDDNLMALNKQTEAFKKEATDMVPVTVRVRKFEKEDGEEGWQYRVEIKEIIKVEAPDPNKEDVIKLAN